MNQREVMNVHQLAKSYGVQTAIKELTFSVYEGQIFGFLGPSGSGKTTTIKLLTGQLRQSAGKAEVLGIPIEKIDARIYEQVGIVTDTSGVYERMSVYDNLKVFADILKVAPKRIDYVLEKVGLLKDKKKIAGKLSKGMGQRLILARAILHEPKVLFLDEPTSGLDPSTAEAIHQLLYELKAKGTAIFLTTHNMEEATKLCDTVALLNDGVIVEQGTPQEVCLKYNQHKAYRIVLSDQTTVILTHCAQTSAQINQWLIDDCLVTIHSCEPTLEQVFLMVTGRELV